MYNQRSAGIGADVPTPEPVSEDAWLVSRISNGDLDALSLLYNKYKGPLYRTALAITSDTDAAEEILQDCFVRAYGALGRLEVHGSLSPWLHRIVVNLSCNWTRRSRQWNLPLDTWLDRLVAPLNPPEQSAERIELAEIVRQALAELGPKHRAAIVLFYLQGFSLVEIAEILDCPVGTVKSRLHYACRALRKKLRQDRRLSGEVVYGAS